MVKKLKRKMIIMFIIIIALTVISIYSISNQDFYEPDEDEINISVLLTSSGFDSIYHENINIISDGKIRIKKNDGTEIVPKNEEYIIDINNCPVGETFHIQPSENCKVTVNSINRAYGPASYFGTLDVYSTQDGFVIVNNLELETYLRFVVPSEMPSDYGLEALKAQSVCARNFAIQHVLSPAYPQYNAALDDSINYQVYNNQKANDNTDRAIKETKNMVLEYNGEIISTYYYSTSWGHSTDLSLWNGGECPYYKSNTLSENKEHMDLTQEEAFKEFLLNYKDAYESSEPWYRWTYYISLEDIRQNLDTFLNMKVEKIDSLEIVSRRAGGSVSNLKLVSGDNTYNLTKESEVRNIFVPINSQITRSDGSVLDTYVKCPSSYYLLEPAYENDVLTGYVLSGGGCGHGLGMSQNCAKLLATEGKDYREILEYFYIGCNVVEYD